MSTNSCQRLLRLIHALGVYILRFLDPQYNYQMIGGKNCSATGASLAPKFDALFQDYQYSWSELNLDALFRATTRAPRLPEPCVKLEPRPGQLIANMVSNSLINSPWRWVSVF